MFSQHFKRFSADNIRKNWLHEYPNDFSVVYDSTEVDDTLDIHKYLMVKNNM